MIWAPLISYQFFFLCVGIIVQEARPFPLSDLALHLYRFHFAEEGPLPPTILSSMNNAGEGPVLGGGASLARFLPLGQS